MWISVDGGFTGSGERCLPVLRQSIDWRIDQDFDSTVSVEALTAEAGMSLSSFHENFRAVTHTSPPQRPRFAWATSQEALRANPGA